MFHLIDLSMKQKIMEQLSRLILEIKDQQAAQLTSQKTPLQIAEIINQYEQINEAIRDCKRAISEINI
jgi:hypothetical protein